MLTTLWDGQCLDFFCYHLQNSCSFAFVGSHLCSYANSYTCPQFPSMASASVYTSSLSQVLCQCESFGSLFHCFPVTCSCCYLYAWFKYTKVCHSTSLLLCICVWVNPSWVAAIVTVTLDCWKDITTQAWEHLVKPFSVSLQMIAFSFCSDFTASQLFWDQSCTNEQSFQSLSVSCMCVSESKSVTCLTTLMTGVWPCRGSVILIEKRYFNLPVAFRELSLWHS